MESMDPAVLVMAAQRLKDSGRTDAAVEVLSAVCERTPEHKEAWDALEQLYASIGEYDEILDLRRMWVEHAGGDAESVDLLEERSVNNLSSMQDYNPCYSKDLICIIGGDANVYTCCTLAFTPQGKIGSLRNTYFKDLWRSEATTDLFKNLDPRKVCTCPCLYERRNRQMIWMVEQDDPPAGRPEGIHRNFI